MPSRREFLKASKVLALAPAIPGFLVRTGRAAEAGAPPKPNDERPVLVVVQLDGGNDGINTVVPFGDEAYARLRPTLRVGAGEALRVADGLGLHPGLRPLAGLLDDGRLALVQGVGYPNPNRSHFESLAIWHSARRDDPQAEAYGWLGRAFDARAGAEAGGPGLVHVGDRGVPPALVGRRAGCTSFDDAADLVLALEPGAGGGIGASPAEGLDGFVRRAVTGAYASAAELAEAAGAKAGADAGRFPDSALGRRLGLVARSIRAGVSAQVYYVVQGGYDTHSAQLATHGALLREFAGAVRALVDDLAAARLLDRVAILAFSEFGRRPEENGSFGTDHGTAGPVFVAGAADRLRAGLLGATPRLDPAGLVGGDLAWSVDFRQVYAAVLGQWLGLDPAPVLGAGFDPVPLFRPA